ncbi:M23 family metallopeptidase [Limibacillus halophilus]|uniref:Murein DD-endopeptidase MepM/ murein hydrolase activator NlpD n=1 Tax=Limibacillus halophilus TaxID=1579333 RepID=A0A839SWP2_9PROT|nr:M23 family metallopeptidase [Limibacillus halophilus]MBB3066728.1 murein DD-endopeptidase MepM/ murein hydrolase activator NlpD [Limibacillus halophilus]
MKLTSLLIGFGLLASAALAQALEPPILEGDATQGGLIRGRTAPGNEVFLDDRKLRVSSDGRFVFGFHRDAPGQAILTLREPGGAGLMVPITVAQRTYDIQRIDGLPNNMVTPPQDLLDRLERERAEVYEARSRDRDLPFALGDFIWPATGPISGVYGSQRILNGQPKQPHYGVDVARPEGTPVVAPAGGVVTLAVTDHYYTGGTIIIDHGFGLTSAFLHLSEVVVEKGQEVSQGDLIGRIGATGRVTGAHLDWRMNWFEERVDPMLVVGPMPQQ